MGVLDSLANWLGGGKQIPIMERSEAGFEQDYRLSDDPPEAIRINQAAPKGLPKRLADFITVAGVSFQQANAISFVKGTGREIELERDPTNKYDKNAIKVIGTWFDQEENEYEELLGWVPAELAKEIPADIRIGATIKSMYVARSGKNAGLRIDIWGPKAKKPKTTA